jgi:pyruvate carboxylase
MTFARNLLRMVGSLVSSNEEDVEHGLGLDIFRVFDSLNYIGQLDSQGTQSILTNP